MGSHLQQISIALVISIGAVLGLVPGDRMKSKQSKPKKTALRRRTNVKAGPNRRPHDHIGNFNFTVEIDGISAG